MPAFVYLIIMFALLLMGLFLVVAVLMQHGKSHGLSGTIAGGAETFFGKDQGNRIDRLLGRMTTIIGIVFVVFVIAVYVIQPDYTATSNNQDVWQSFSSVYSGFSN